MWSCAAKKSSYYCVYLVQEHFCITNRMFQHLFPSCAHDPDLWLCCLMSSSLKPFAASTLWISEFGPCLWNCAFEFSGCRLMPICCMVFQTSAHVVHDHRWLLQRAGVPTVFSRLRTSNIFNMSLEVLLGILAQLPITPDSCICVMSLFSTVWGYRLKKICSPQSRNVFIWMSVDKLFITVWH